jgi:hypothetical protein
LRNTLKMSGGASGHLTVKAKLKYAGKCRMYAAYGGSPGYTPSTSATKAFTVK